MSQDDKVINDPPKTTQIRPYHLQRLSERNLEFLKKHFSNQFTDIELLGIQGVNTICLATYNKPINIVNTMAKSALTSDNSTASDKLTTSSNEQKSEDKLLEFTCKQELKHGQRIIMKTGGRISDMRDEYLLAQKFLRVDRENIIKVYDAFVLDDMYVLILEYIQYDLFEVIAQQLDYDKKLAMRQILNGVKNCHEENIAHLDIKPENILVMLPSDDLTSGDLTFGNLTSDDNDDIKVKAEHQQLNQQVCKIIDFGSCKLSGEFTKRDGTIKFYSPECMANHILCMKPKMNGKKEDIWSLGITFMMMIMEADLQLSNCEQDMTKNLTRIFQFFGRPPAKSLLAFKAEECKIPLETIAVCDNLPLRLAQLLGIQDGKLLDLLSRMLQYNPDKRPTVKELLKHPYFYDA